MVELLRTISPRDKNAHTAYGRCISYSETPLLVVGWTDVEGWNANESWNGVWNGVTSVAFPAPLGKKMKFSGTPVSGRF